jgi:superfamily II DNA or RNA helicase
MTATLLKPRDYQLDCIRAIHEKWDAGIWRPASVLPTGAGKTVVFSHLAETYLLANPAKRVLILSHTDELVLQAAAKMRNVAPHREVGIVKAERNEVHAHVISASVQSLRSPARREKIRNVGLIIVDEAHHAVAPTYLAILRHFGALAPEEAPVDWKPTCRAAGFTATLVRADQGKLSEVWEDVAFRRDIAFMIRRGYLLDVRGKRVEVPEFDLAKVKKSGGDYAEGSLGEALIESLAPEVVAKAYVEHASDRQGLIFTPTVDSAYAFAEAFNEAGIKTEVVHGALARDARREILQRLADGDTQCVANCMVLTEGFDNPKVSCAVIARPTKSTGLYQQMVGRVLRPDLTLPVDQRGHALIMDVVGVSRKHDLRSLVDLSSREDLEDVDEDLSLLELEDLILDVEDNLVEGVLQGPDDEYYAGPVEVAEFDPLGRDSTRAWAVTPDGTYFMSAGSAGYVFLADSLEGPAGTFDVVWCTKELHPHSREPQAGMTEHKGLSFEMAISWGEEVALDMGGHGAKTLTAKRSAWRNEPATGPQVYRARRLGITVPMRWDDETVPDITKGELSAMIDAATAARRIDPLVRTVMKARK